MMISDDTRATAGDEARAVAPDPDGFEAPEAADGGADGNETSAGGNPSSLDESVIAAFEQELADARRKADENWDKYLRAEADLDNLRRRSRRQSDAAVRLVRRDLLTRFLDVADNLELALGHSDADPAAVVVGVEGTYRDLARILDQEGVEPIDALDKPFDPNLHEAIGVVMAPGVEEELVVSVERTGYSLDGDTLRPARVLVGKPVDVESAGDGNAD